MKHIDATIGAFAAQNHGVITLDDGLDLGVSLDQIRERVKSGRLIPLHERVYRAAGAPATWHGELLAAVRAAGPAAYASHHSFALLFDLRGTYSTRPEITVVGTQLPILRGVRVHRIDRLAKVDTTRRAGIPCLAPPLGLLLLGGRLPEVALHNAVHDAVHQRYTTVVKLQEVWNAYGGRGRPGSGKLRRAIQSLPPSGRGTQTGLEFDLYRVLVTAEIGEPELQYPILDANGEQRFLDVAYVIEKIDLEADGERDHTSPGARSADRRRDAAMRALGWAVKRYTKTVIQDEPHRIEREVRALVEQRQTLSPRRV